MKFVIQRVKEAKVEVVLNYGVAFCGKHVEICLL